MQSNSATTRRRGGRGRVSIYLLLGAGIGAFAALLLAPRKGSKARKVFTTGDRTDRKNVVGSLRKVAAPVLDMPTLDNRAAAAEVIARPTVNIRKRSTRTVMPTDMRISEQRYRVAHSGRRPSNIL